MDRVPGGFDLTLLKQSKGGAIASVGRLAARVERQGDGAQVLFVRFIAGEILLSSGEPVSAADGVPLPVPPTSEPALNFQYFKVPAGYSPKTQLDALVDVPIIMGSMPEAIRKACYLAMPRK